MSAFNLSAHRTWFLEQAYPAYQTLGNLAFAYCTIYTQLWTQGALPLVQIEALEQLFAFVEGKV